MSTSNQPQLITSLKPSNHEKILFLCSLLFTLSVVSVQTIENSVFFIINTNNVETKTSGSSANDLINNGISELLNGNEYSNLKVKFHLMQEILGKDEVKRIVF